MFSREFDTYIYLNLEIADEAELFTRKLSVEDLFQAICLHKNTVAAGNKVLLFIDEIQACPEALAMLRFFHEKLNRIYVIAAGSLFEIMMDEKRISFPAGRVEYLFMHPLSFDEYLAAMGETRALETWQTLPAPEYARVDLLNHFHKYTLIGGMPEVVAEFAKTKEAPSLNRIYRGLLTSYLDDVSKYARNSAKAALLRHCIESAPYEAGSRITFAGFGKSHYGSREMAEAVRTLERAMLIFLLHPSTSNEIPIVPDINKSPRLQLLDTGLLNFTAGLQGHFFENKDLHSFYRGILAQHITGQELLCLDCHQDKRPCFWVREKKQSNAEVDFVIQYESNIIPIEVKAGKTGTLRSLHQFMDVCRHEYAIRLYSGPLRLDRAVTPRGKSFMLLNLPYFLTGKIYEYLSLLVNGKMEVRNGA